MDTAETDALRSAVASSAYSVADLALINRRPVCLRGMRSAAFPGADEQLLHLLGLNRSDRQRLERGSFRTEALECDPRVAAPEVRADVLGRVHDCADHQQDDAVVLRGRVGADLAGGLRALDQLRGEW